MKMFFYKLGMCGFIALIASLSIWTVSCNKKLDIDASNLISEKNQWQSFSDTKASLLGVYGLMRAALLNNNAHWIYGELRHGDFASYNRSDLDALIHNDLKAAYPITKDLANWRRFYAAINAASIFIERAHEVLPKDSRYTEINWKYDVAQARAIRAFMYFYLVRVWGEVPLIDKAYDDGSFTAFKQSSENTVLAFAESELLKAAQDLPYFYGVSPQTYYGEGSAVWAPVLFNKLSAYAILAHVAAWQGKYINTDVYAQFVLNNYTKIGADMLSIDELTAITGTFSSSASFSQIVSIPGNYNTGEATSTGHIEELTLAYPLVLRPYPDIYIPRDTITNVFTSMNDQRFGVDTVSGLTRTAYFTNFTGELPIFSKIKILRNSSPDNSYSLFGSRLIFTRVEEMMLLRAEAVAVLGQKPEAMRLLNQVRSLRGYPIYSEDSPKDIVDEIFAERRRELMGEGWRWYDQVRHNRIRKVNTTVYNLLDNGGIYWPVATEVLKNNNRLVQNNYWQ